MLIDYAILSHTEVSVVIYYQALAKNNPKYAHIHVLVMADITYFTNVV